MPGWWVGGWVSSGSLDLPLVAQDRCRGMSRFREVVVVHLSSETNSSEKIDVADIARGSSLNCLSSLVNVGLAGSLVLLRGYGVLTGQGGCIVIAKMDESLQK